MASGRMLRTAISQSKKYARLASDFVRMLFLMLIPWADRAGREKADPAVIKGVVLTRLDVTEEQIADALDNMAEVGVIQLYSLDGEAFLEVVDFLEHNKPNQRERDSSIPAPSDPTCTPMRFTDMHVAPPPNRNEGNHEMKEEGNGEGKRTAQCPDVSAPYADRPSPEEVFEETARTGSSPNTAEHRFRERLRRLAGPDFAREHAEDVPRWSREHTLERLEELWEASKPILWADTAKAEKRRVWIFADLLNQDIVPRDELTGGSPLADYQEQGL